MEEVKERKKKEEEEEEDNNCEWKKFTHKELEEQYSPSRWSSKHGSTEIIPKHVQLATARTEVARGAVPVRVDVAYGPGTRAKLDVYGEDLPNDAPLLVYVHGGYWQELHKDVSAYLVPPLYKAGVLTITLGYHLAPQVGVADIVEEIRMGVLWACKLARGRGSAGVVLSGWSAGAHLVTQVLSEEENQSQLTPYRDLIRGAVTFSGIFDLRPLVTTYVNDPLHLTSEKAWALSPFRGVGGLARAWATEKRAGGPLRLLVLVGDQDSPEFIRQSKEYCKACVSAGVRGSCVVLDNSDHFSLVCDLFLEDFAGTERLHHFVDVCCGRRKEKKKLEEEGVMGRSD